MNEPKDFLSRWSQRKLNPEVQKPAEEKLPLAETGKNAVEGAAAEPELDITALPSLESIGADSDIRVFLQRGVPASLTHAALRRAWSADPAIRDFVGLSENSWDFNAPDSVPGFGSLNADEVRRVAARLFGEPAQDSTAQASPTEAQKSPEKPAETEQPKQYARNIEPEPPGRSVPEKPIDGAVQQESPEESPSSGRAQQRHHGTALPK
jgi:hypothetical protein